MDYEQLASFEPALARFLEKVRHCFKRDKTFGPSSTVGGVFQKSSCCLSRTYERFVRRFVKM